MEIKQKSNNQYLLYKNNNNNNNNHQYLFMPKQHKPNRQLY